MSNTRAWMQKGNPSKGVTKAERLTPPSVELTPAQKAEKKAKRKAQKKARRKNR